MCPPPDDRDNPFGSHPFGDAPFGPKPDFGNNADGAGSANIDVSVTGAGAANTNADGSANIDISATATGAATANADGAANIDINATAVGAPLASADGSANVDFNATGVGEATADAAGSAVIEFNATAQSDSGAADGEANIDISATAVGEALVDAVGEANIDISANAVGAFDAAVVSAEDFVVGPGRPSRKKKPRRRDELEELLDVIRARIEPDEPVIERRVARAELVLSSADSTAKEISAQIAAMRRVLDEIDDEEVLLLAA